VEREQDDLNSGIAREVLKKRILLADASRKSLETPQEVFPRMA
jgi:ribonucleotide reductase alpha subunit